MSSPCRVVVCDDVADLRELLVLVLNGAEGIEVVGEAGNGQEAINVAGVTRPDVMLLDLAMPVMDGMEALPKILEVSPTTRVIVLTGFGSEEMRTRALATGATAYLEKGARPGEIVTAVHGICA